MTNTRDDWENPSVQRVMGYPMHTPTGAYETEAQALTCDRNLSARVVVLDGDWKFFMAPSPEEAPADFYREAYDDSEWDVIPVPGCWEYHGYGDPVYTNTLYPFRRSGGESHYEIGLKDDCFVLNPPKVPQENRTGCYRRIFLWKEETERDVFIEFEGVESCFYLWINGKFAGFSKDSKLSAEFCITPYVRSGENVVAVQVLQFCDGSYLEDQDYWHLYGITRSVRMYSRPMERIEDFKIETLFPASENMDYDNALLSVTVWPNRQRPFYGKNTVRITLYDAQDCRVGTVQSRPFADYADYLRPQHIAKVELPVAHPILWSDENPYLYKAVISLLGPSGELLDVEGARVGFREVRLSPEGVLLLNGKRMVIRGVNRHDFCPETGRIVSEERMRKEILLMKRLNFNAVRTCHYPDNTRWYDLCDELGILLVDEADIETHGIGGTLSASAEWTNAYMDRGMRMVLRDKNHPSVILWSLGNESGAGANQAAMYGWIKEYDKTRYVQYESGNPGGNISDVIAPMYPSMEWMHSVMADVTDLRPFIMCEYAYAKSNSNGNFGEFWDNIRRYPRFQGGFIWDFSDKAIWRDGRYLYGGAFGEAVQDPVPDMCLNGVVFPDLTPKPGTLEVQYVQAPVQILPILRGTTSDKTSALAKFLIVQNEFHTRDLTEYELKWELVEDGSVRAAGTFPLHAGAGQEEALSVRELLEGSSESIAPEEIITKSKGECYLNCQVVLARDTFYASAGHVVTQRQIALNAMRRKPELQVVSGETVLLEERETEFVITAGEITLAFDRRQAYFSSICRNGRELLRGGNLQAFRAPTGVDDGEVTHGNSYAVEWRQGALSELTGQLEVAWLSVAAGDTHVLIQCRLRYPVSGLTADVTWTVGGRGIRMSGYVANESGLDTLPRIGFSFAFPKSTEQIVWYGRGPQETYPDRKSTAFIGRYNSDVSKQHVPYIVPCECGGHEDTSWVSLGSGDDMLTFGAAGRFHFSALPYATQAYARAAYCWELEEDGCNYLNLDICHAGLGGDTGWTKNIHPEYRIGDGVYPFDFALIWR